MEALIKINVKDRVGATHVIEAPTDVDLNLMEVLKGYELPVEGVCGGMALCASCHCYVHSDHVEKERNDAEQAMLDETNDVLDNSRLACQIRIVKELDGLEVELAPESVAEQSGLDDW